MRRLEGEATRPGGELRTGRWVYHNGRFLPFGEVTLPLTTQALHYGTGVFDGIRAFVPAAGQGLNLFRAHDHFRRFLRSCRQLRIEAPNDHEHLVDATIKLLQYERATTDVYIRPLAYKVALLPGTPPGVGLQGISGSVSVVVQVLGPYYPESGIRCAVSSWRHPGRAMIPVDAKLTGGYVNNALAVDEARDMGYDDAILLDERGQVTEASTSNVFTVVNGHIVTPPRGAAILPGITRDTVLTFAHASGIRVVERELSVRELLDAEEVFLTGTGVGVVPVVEISGRRIGDGAPGSLTAALVRSYSAAVRAEVPDPHGWRTHVPFAWPRDPAP